MSLRDELQTMTAKAREDKEAEIKKKCKERVKQDIHKLIDKICSAASNGHYRVVLYEDKELPLILKNEHFIDSLKDEFPSLTIEAKHYSGFYQDTDIEARWL